jgi:hypothetical protein
MMNSRFSLCDAFDDEDKPLNKQQRCSTCVPSPPWERDRVRGKSMIYPLTLTLSPEKHGGEGTYSVVP